MKLTAFLTAGLIVAGATAPVSALDGVLFSGASRGPAKSLFLSISCNVNDDDKQAICMRTCDDDYIKASQAYGTAGRLDGPKEAKKACETKCGC